MTDRRLDAALAALVEEDAAVAPPVDLAPRALTAWDAARARGVSSEVASRSRGRAPRGLIVLAAVAATITLAAILPRPLVPGPRPKPVPRPSGYGASSPGRDVVLAAPAVAVAVKVEPKPGAEDPARAVARQSRGLAQRSPARQPSARSVLAGGAAHGGASRTENRAATVPRAETLRFVTLAPDAEGELARGFALSRVRIPRHVLVGLGLLDAAHPGGDPDPDAPVDADVAFSEDGQAKAIRVTPARFAR